MPILRLLFNFGSFFDFRDLLKGTFGTPSSPQNKQPQKHIKEFTQKDLFYLRSARWPSLVGWLTQTARLVIPTVIAELRLAVSMCAVVAEVCRSVKIVQHRFANMFVIHTTEPGSPSGSCLIDPCSGNRSFTLVRIKDTN